MALEEILIEGYLGHDPSRPLQDNLNLVTFSVGVSQSKKNKENGGWDSKTTWYKVNSWNEINADYLYQTLKKGNKVVVKGRPSIYLWKSKKTGEQKAMIVIDADRIVTPAKNLETIDEGIISKQAQPKTKISTTPKPVYEEIGDKKYLSSMPAERHQDLDDEIPF